MYAIGVDVGGTKVSAATVDTSGQVVNSLRVPTADTPERLVDDIVSLIEQLAASHEICAVGLAIAGFLDLNREVIYHSPNLPLTNVPIKAMLQSRLSYPVFVENDANAAGWAEWRFSTEAQNVFMLTIGTGIGGAAIMDGKLLKGGFGVAAEPGHLAFVPGGILCGCGQRGCSEQYASGNTLLRLTREAKPDFPTDQPASEVMARLLEEGDPAATASLRQVAENVGRTAAMVAAILDPEVFIIGGGVSKAGEEFLKDIEDSFRRHLPSASVRPIARFQLARFYNDAGVIGIADLARSLR